jgi:hypothetical protein
MIPVIVTLQYVRDGVKDSKRLTLAMDHKVHEIVLGLISDLKLPLQNDGDPITYHLLRQRQVLDDDDLLFEAGVQEGDILQLASVDSNATVGKAMTAGLLNRLGGKSSQEPLLISAGLVTVEGEIYHLKHTRALIGRADISRGYPPETLDADLTDLDPGKSVSRPHALIVFADNEFTIRDLYSQRGLLINGQPVSPSKAQVLHDGDVLTLGDVEVQFRCET